MDYTPKYVTVQMLEEFKDSLKQELSSEYGEDNFNKLFDNKLQSLWDKNQEDIRIQEEESGKEFYQNRATEFQEAFKNRLEENPEFGAVFDKAESKIAEIQPILENIIYARDKEGGFLYKNDGVALVEKLFMDSGAWEEAGQSIKAGENGIAGYLYNTQKSIKEAHLADKPESLDKKPVNKNEAIEPEKYGALNIKDKKGAGNFESFEEVTSDDVNDMVIQQYN